MTGHDLTATQAAPGTASVARLENVSLNYGATLALDNVSLEIPSGRMMGLIGPDGVGKSSLLSLIAGAREIQSGRVEVLGGDMAAADHRRDVCPRIAYMPQGLGKNLYATLSVFENIDFFARLFGQDRAERERRIADLTESVGLAPFVDRPAGKLSGGMKQKVGLCCALIHDPDLLILDEPTTGVDPLSRRQFWELIDRIRVDRPGMSVMVATAYMDEAARFDWLVAMDEGQVLATGTTQELLARTKTTSLEEAFVALLPETKTRGHEKVTIPPREAALDGEIAIEAQNLTKRYGNFVAVDNVNFRIERGEIFGFLGSNGCGKSTTMKMLTGLQPASEGKAFLFGKEVDPNDLETRRHVGYMSQAFSLYSELTVRQNLELHARLFHLPPETIAGRIAESAERFGLTDDIDALPDSLSLGQRQRLSLAVAMIHQPAMLILDEPTSGVDPVARDGFWQELVTLSRRDKVTIFISTHFMNEAARCDRISLMHAGRVLVSDTPEGLVKTRGVDTLEDAFILYLEEAAGEAATEAKDPPKQKQVTAPAGEPSPHRAHRYFDPRRMFSYAMREAIELRRDPIRATLAVLGSVILMFIMGYGVNMDIEDLSYAVLDRDETTTSRDYTLNLSGSRYFVERPPISDYTELDRRMRTGELSLTIEIPPGFGRDVARGRPVQIGAWIDGAMPTRAETVKSYVQAMHTTWLTQKAAGLAQDTGSASLANIEIRFKYNPDVRSLPAMVPAVIPLLLLLIPAMLASLSIVREKELGSIVNFYVTPTTKLEFLLGKQVPYILLGLLNFALMTLLAVTLFGVPLKGSFLTLLAGTLLYLVAATAMGLFTSSFMRSQIAAIFGTAIITLLPASQYSGMIDPVSSLEGVGAMIGQTYPMTHYLTITRGTFSKALDFSNLHASFLPLLLAGPILIALSAAFLKKQDG